MRLIYAEKTDENYNTECAVFISYEEFAQYRSKEGWSSTSENDAIADELINQYNQQSTGLRR